MNIGIDVDGVLVDLGTYQLTYGIPYFREKYGMEVKNPKGYDIQDVFQCTREQREQFWTKYIWAYCLKAPMTEGAAETVAALKKAGHRIVIITGRAHTTEKGVTGALFRAMLKYWLRKNRFPYDEIIFCSESESAADKLEACRKKQIDVMIDDKPENLFALKDSVKIVCYPAIWNEDIHELDPFRIQSFRELHLS